MDTLSFQTKVSGTSYLLPTYRVTLGGLEATGEFQEIGFVRGAQQATPGVASTDGILIETLLQMMIIDLEYKHSLVPGEEGARTISHLRSALDALNARTYRRQMRGVYCSYKA